MNGGAKARAIKRLGISEEIYDELCVDFSVMAREKTDLLERAATAGDMSQAAKLAHSIKGSAANLGIDDVFEIARVIEAVTARGALDEKVMDEIGRLKQCIGAT